MMRWQIRTFLELALLVSAALLVACDRQNHEADSSSEPTVEAYFEQLGAAQKHLVTRNAALLDEMQIRPNASEEENLMALRQTMRDMKDFADESYEMLRAITPSSEVREQHERYLDGAAQGKAFFGEVADSLEGAETWAGALETLEKYFPDRFTPIKDQVDESCLALQAIATANSIEADLMCL